MDSANVAIGVTGLAAAILTWYLAVLAVAAIFHRPARGDGRVPALRVAVFIPAHDEEQLVTRCLLSVLEQDYPAPLRRVIVIADNCSDATARVAALEGVEVWVRDEPALRGKGHALRWAADRLLKEPDPPDAVIVIDADSVVEPGALGALAAAAEDGQDAVQAEYLVLEESGGTRERLLATAFLLFHRVRFRGLAQLRLPVALVGNGMLFTRRLLEAQPWRSFSAVEDLEQTMCLRLAHVHVQFAASARVLGPMASGARAERRQRLRWEGGRFHVVRRWLPRLLSGAVRHRDLGLLAAALDLAVPPLTLLALICLGGMGVAGVLAMVGFVARPLVLIWLAALAALPVYVSVGLVAGAAERRHYAALLAAPAFILRKIAAYLRLSRGFDAALWEPTRARSDATRQRVAVAGIPVDVLDVGQALGWIVERFGRRPATQVCTVNLDFLVRASRDPETHRVLRSCDLSVADGWPVVLLGRVTGSSIRERVAGLDLVPMAVEEAARRGAGVFLLGGQDGVAQVAARRLQERFPTLRVAWHEPPLGSVEDFDDEGILTQIRSAQAELLLVAFGHPKQEHWIARNRHLLPVSVAIGVGCGLDVMAGRVSRAPRWMQRTGLEWLHRLRLEPRRLLRRYLACLLWLGAAIPRTLAERRTAAGRATL